MIKMSTSWDFVSRENSYLPHCFLRLSINMCHCIGQNLWLTTNNEFQFQPSCPVKRVEEAVGECMKMKKHSLGMRQCKCSWFSSTWSALCIPPAQPAVARRPLSVLILSHGQSRTARPARLLHGNRNTSSCRHENLGKDEVRNPYSHSMSVGLFAGP